MTITLLTGDCRDVLPTLPADSVHCVVCSPPYYALRSYLDASHPDKHREIGSEPTPEAYLATMVGVFREVRRVMRNDAVAFINVGDSYRDKQLLLMPARLALALQADGWWVRSQLPWVKRSCMPESATDRPTSAIEYVFMLTKSARCYWDADAVKRVGAYPAGTKAAKGSVERAKHANGRPPEYATYTGTRNFRNSDLFFGSFSPPHGLITGADGMPLALDVNPAAFAGSHFATFAPGLIEPLISGGTSERGCCAACGKPWVRTTQASFVPTQDPANTKGGDKGLAMPGWNFPRGRNETTTTGWQPGCKCDAGDPTPCTVLDPFLGSGTTALVADRLQRHAIGIDLSLTYAAMAQRRIEMDCPLFTSWAPAEDPEEARMADLFEGDEYQRLPVPAGPKYDGFRHGKGAYVNQGPHPSNGTPEAAE